MASQREIRRRIGAVQNIKQITRAFQFVAASKLKRAQDSTLAARPYSERIDEVLADLAAVLTGEDHPLLSKRPEVKRLIILITTDRGLAGPLNTNTIRFAAREITDHKGDLAVVTVGRKGRDAMRRARVPVEAHFAGFGDRPSFADILPLARLVSDDYRAGTYDRVDIVYSHFVSTLSQRPTMDPLLPVQPAVHTDATTMSQRSDDMLFDAIAAGGYVLGRSNRMPGFGATLTSAEIRGLVRYIRELCRCAGPAWAR